VHVLNIIIISKICRFLYLYRVQNKLEKYHIKLLLKIKKIRY